MYASRKIKSGSQRISIHLKLPLGVFDFDVIYERNEIERQKKRPVKVAERKSKGFFVYTVHKDHTVGRVRNSAIFDH